MKRPRLLIVDDDYYTRHGLRNLFARKGWEVSLASTVAEGLAGLDVAPDCVILDLNLPDGSGEAILREIRARALPALVAVCSASADAHQIAIIRGLRPELMLCKPIDLGPLDRMCELAMAG